MQPAPALPSRHHRNGVIGRPTDRLNPDPRRACRRYGGNRSSLWSDPGISLFSPAGPEGFLPTLHPTVKAVAMMVNAWPVSSCHGEIALDGVLGRAMTRVAAEDTGEVCRGRSDPRFDDLAAETGEGP